MTNTKPLTIGHRGAKGHVLENTIPSFEKAFELGADGIELDVHVCKTGEVVVFHDLNLTRFFNDDRNISEITLSEMRALRLDEKYHIPTLAEVLEMLPQSSVLNIELKGRQTAKPVFELLKKISFLPETTIVSSFYKQELEAYRLLDAHAKLGVLTNFDFLKSLAFSKKIGAYAVHPHYSLIDGHTVQLIKNLQKAIFVWTVNEPNEITRLKALEIDGIISDYPERCL